MPESSKPPDLATALDAVIIEFTALQGLLAGVAAQVEVCRTVVRVALNGAVTARRASKGRKS